MPGQSVNVLEVPRDQPAGASSDLFPGQTLDPAAKFQRPRPAPVPALPRLATDDTTLGKTARSFSYPFSNEARSESLQAPQSAGPGLGSRRRWHSSGDVRRARSAASSPVSAIRSAFQQLKGSNGEESSPASRSVSPGGPSSDRGRGRSRRPREDTAELKISRPTLISRSDSLSECITLGEDLAPGERAPSRDENFSPLRCHPVDEVDAPPAPAPPFEIGQALSSDSAVRSSSPDTPVYPPRTRSASARTPSPLARRLALGRTDHRRSSSLGGLREPSPLRNSVAVDDDNSVHIPEEIAEADDEDAEAESGTISPLREFSRSSLASDASSSGDARPSSRRGSADSWDGLRATPAPAPVPHAEKELPALPAYLVPAPLKIRPSFPTASRKRDSKVDDGEDGPVSEKVACAVPAVGAAGSHFSVWSMASPAPPSSPPGSSTPPESPSLSALTEGSSTGARTPWRISQSSSVGERAEERDGAENRRRGVCLESLAEGLGVYEVPDAKVDPAVAWGGAPTAATAAAATADVMRQHSRGAAGTGRALHSPRIYDEEEERGEDEEDEEEARRAAAMQQKSISHIERLLAEFGYLGDAVH